MAWRTKSGQSSEPNYDRRGTEVRRGIEVKDYSDAWRRAEYLTKDAAKTPEERRADHDRIMRQLFSRDD